MSHTEKHRLHRSGWLRAAVLGANDGIVSTASLLMGVAAANSSSKTMVLAGLAGLCAGSLSMAAGEYVSVQSHADIEAADLRIEEQALRDNWDIEVEELAGIYERRGVEPNLAKEVAEQMMAKDALGTHARDEIGISGELSAQPFLAACTSAGMFAVGASVPLLSALALQPSRFLMIGPVIVIAALFLIGGLAARVGGANVLRGAFRVCLWGSFAMGVTTLVGKLFATIH